MYLTFLKPIPQLDEGLNGLYIIPSLIQMGNRFLKCLHHDHLGPFRLNVQVFKWNLVSLDKSNTNTNSKTNGKGKAKKRPDVHTICYKLIDKYNKDKDQCPHNQYKYLVSFDKVDSLVSQWAWPVCVDLRRNEPAD